MKSVKAALAEIVNARSDDKIKIEQQLFIFGFKKGP
jgi:hypothetical protein